VGDDFFRLPRGAAGDKRGGKDQDGKQSQQTFHTTSFNMGFSNNISMMADDTSRPGRQIAVTRR
jgi:hypothetical protein